MTEFITKFLLDGESIATMSFTDPHKAMSWCRHNTEEFAIIKPSGELLGDTTYRVEEQEGAHPVAVETGRTELQGGNDE